MATPTSDLTEATVTGNGVFDQLMKAAKAHLEQEYSNNRIKGKEYAEVYLGSMVAVLDQAVKFMGIRQQDALIAAQIAKTNAERDLVNAQIAKTNADRDLVNAQLGLIPDQKAQMQAQTQLIGQQKTNLIAEGLNIPKQGILLDKQADKSDAEKDILVQKKKTEEAQIKDIVDGVAVTGVIGKQKTLYERQADGFLRDAEQKMAKLMADVWAVQRTTDEGFQPSTQLANSSIDSVVNKAKQGIGA